MNVMKYIYSLLLVIFTYNLSFAQNIPLPSNLPQEHPRLLTTAKDKKNLQKQVKEEGWAKDVMNGILERIDPYVKKTQSQPDWLSSRMMMYWKSKATNVYIKGGIYSHADGKAPVPTVRFGSTRGVSSPIKRPKIEDIIPYMDDTKGVYFHNSSKEGNPLEWADQANVSGSSIESINEEIIKLGKDASFIYWLNNDEKYGKFAFELFDTYMMGMHYRNEPIDLSNSHAQTLVGLSTFEVIQERILAELSYLYDFLHPYIQKHHAEKIEKYESTFKKWTDVTIKNGVPQNNWNLHQAKFILKVAMVLQDNERYTDLKGRQYYIDYILNQTSSRQWALTKFMDYGYDNNNGVWNECPSYAQGVTKDLTNFIRDYDNTFNQNLLPYTPVMKEAVKILPQYLFPNRQITAFGDTYYSDIYTEPFSDMIRLSQKYKNKEDEYLFTQIYKLLNGDSNELIDKNRKLPAQINSFFTSKPLVLDSKAGESKIEDFATQTFYAPNVSWFVQRNGMDKENGMMISQNASFGNHMHSNGISMELYGKGYVLGAESGIGSSYFEKPYLEYYSQFPAHNTVMVDGISKYPEMLSNHAFDLLSSYPVSGQKEGYYPNISFSDVYFLEPESRSDQQRFLSIVRTGETSGYYIDIFRSKKQRKGDKFHDYFYHNLGQELFIQNAKGDKLDLLPSEEMAFAGGHLFALDYMWDKQSVKTNKDYQAIWKMSMPNSNHIYMNLWMKGYEGREVFSIKSPPCKAFRGNHGIPYKVEEEPYLTIAARQHGEAWNHPFVSVFEPTTENEGRTILSIESFEVENTSPDFVGLIVKSKSNRVDYIFSSVKNEKVSYKDMTTNGTYALISQQRKDFTLFLGNGTYLSANGISMMADKPTTATVEYKDGNYYFTCDAPVTLRVHNKEIKIDRMDYKKIEL